MALAQKIAVISIENYYDKSQLEKLKEKYNYIEKLFSQNSFFIERMQYKIHKIEYINEMINVVLKNISKHKQQMLYMKYKKKYTLQKISLELNVSLATLNLWDKKILEFIAQIIFYTLEKEELNIFNLEMLGDFIGALNKFICKIEDGHYKYLDTDSGFLNNLKMKRSNYMYYYIMGLHKVLNTKGTVRKILEEKMNDREITTKEIASKYGISRSSVSWYLLAAKID